MKTHFGEDFTQEETYYILDTKIMLVYILGSRKTLIQKSSERNLRIALKTLRQSI